jgi:coenzyme F420 biosynthesis associated uncharacterized protein
MSEAFVDWGLARHVAAAVAGTPGEGGDRFGAPAVAEACARAAASVRSYTGLAAEAELPRGEVVGRREWAQGALESLRELAASIDRRAADSIDLPGPLGPLARRLAGAAAGAEAGGAVGLAGRRVLAQLDVSLADPSRPPRLLFIPPNVAAAHAQIGGEPEAFLAWIATHEMTHAAQFAGVPWLRGHLAGELRALLADAAGGIEPRRIAAALRRALSSDPRRAIQALLRGEAVLALAGPEQRTRLDRIQAAMSLIEGYAEHVMDVADPERREERAALRVRLARRREARGGLGEAVARMLGLELKLRQYRLGKSFCDRIAAEDGIPGLNRAWRGPDAIPSLAELERPERWRERVAGAPAAGGASAAA